MTSIKINLSIPGEPNLEAIYREGLDREVRPLFAQEDFERFNQNLALPLLTSLFPEQTYYFNRNSLYQNIDKPGLLLWGENDETLPIEAARVFSQNLAAANVAHQLVTVPNSWHVPFYDSPEVHHREVMQFISSKL